MTAPGKAIVTIDDAAIEARVRGLLAQAWDEGAKAYSDVKSISQWADPINPYRDEAQA